MSRGFMAVATMLMRSNYLGLPPRVVSVSQLANKLLTNYLMPEATFVPSSSTPGFFSSKTMRVL